MLYISSSYLIAFVHVMQYCHC